MSDTNQNTNIKSSASIEYQPLFTNRTPQSSHLSAWRVEIYHEFYPDCPESIDPGWKSPRVCNPIWRIRLWDMLTVGYDLVIVMGIQGGREREEFLEEIWWLVNVERDAGLLFPHFLVNFSLFSFDSLVLISQWKVNNLRLNNTCESVENISFIGKINSAFLTGKPNPGCWSHTTRGFSLTSKSPLNDSERQIKMLLAIRRNLSL